MQRLSNRSSLNRSARWSGLRHSARLWQGARLRNWLSSAGVAVLLQRLHGIDSLLQLLRLFGAELLQGVDCVRHRRLSWLTRLSWLNRKCLSLPGHLRGLRCWWGRCSGYGGNCFAIRGFVPIGTHQKGDTGREKQGQAEVRNPVCRPGFIRTEFCGGFIVEVIVGVVAAVRWFRVGVVRSAHGRRKCPTSDAKSMGAARSMALLTIRGERDAR